MRKTITLTRASVSLADDINGNHLIKVGIEADWRIGKILSFILGMDYLPIIYGGVATWSVASDRPIAIISQGTQEPILLCGSEYPFYVFSNSNNLYYNLTHLHFNYHEQIDTKIVLKVLSHFHTIESI